MISIARGTEMWIVKLTQHCDLEGIDHTQFCCVSFGSVLARNWHFGYIRSVNVKIFLCISYVFCPASNLHVLHPSSNKWCAWGVFWVLEAPITTLHVVLSVPYSCLLYRGLLIRNEAYPHKLVAAWMRILIGFFLGLLSGSQHYNRVFPLLLEMWQRLRIQILV